MQISHKVRQIVNNVIADVHFIVVVLALSNY